jgi:hypothetical protein
MQSVLITNNHHQSINQSINQSSKQASKQASNIDGVF